MKRSLISIIQILGYILLAFITNKIANKLAVFYIVSIIYMILMAIVNYYIIDKENIL